MQPKNSLSDPCVLKASQPNLTLFIRRPLIPHPPPCSEEMRKTTSGFRNAKQEPFPSYGGWSELTTRICENSTSELCVLDEAYGTGSCIADVVNWGYSVLSESGFLVLSEWTHPERTGPIGDNCTPSPPRRHTHSNRQRLVVGEVKLKWIEYVRVIIERLELSPPIFQGEERGDPCPGHLPVPHSWITVYLCISCVRSYRIVAVNLCVSLACQLPYSCRKPLRVTCVSVAVYICLSVACQLPYTFACHLRFSLQNG